MHFVLRLVLIAQICASQCRSEWVKISQTSVENKNASAGPDAGEGKHLEITYPSPEWIEYQKERFGGNNSSQRLVISGESHLKTSAEIVVPAKISDSKAQRNRIIQTKTKLSFEDSASKETDRSTTEATRPSSEAPPPEAKPAPNSTFEGDLKFPSFMGFLTFLTSLQRSLLTKTSFGIMDKIKVLKSIRDQLMLNIEDRFGSMFPKSRQKRGLTDESNFQFPSEAALMSISFLTFSVFLIKLVLQVIHIIKSKHYTYAGMAMNNMNAMAMTKSRTNARSFGESPDDLETLRKVSAAIQLNPFADK